MKTKIAKVIFLLGVLAVVFGYVGLSLADGDDPPTNPGDPEPDLPLSSSLSPTAGTLLEVMVVVFFVALNIL